MRKGISPIVAVVLLIAIAVIAAVGLYFWVGGLATKQPTPSTPIVITAQKIDCNITDSSNHTMEVLIQNLDASSTYTNATQAPFIIDDDGDVIIASDVAPDISPGEQGFYVFDGTDAHTARGNYTAGNSYVIISAAGAGQAVVTC